jgi:hypothetical protein
MRTKLTLATLIALISCNAAAAGWASSQPISFLHVFEGHGGIFVRQAAMVNPDSCTRTDQYLLRQTHPLFKELYAMLLSARSSDRSMMLYLQGCAEGFPSISHVYY